MEKFLAVIYTLPLALALALALRSPIAPNAVGLNALQSFIQRVEGAQGFPAPSQSPPQKFETSII